jgi:protein-S-isoprenylcysteine O-methyltransferase Ste14
MIVTMNNTKKNLWTALTILWSILMITQIVLAFFFNKDYLPFAKYIGWGFIFLSAIFGIVPIFTFRKKGRVERGKSYIHTTRVVTSGIYSIVRHPQYMAGVLINIGIILISQHWLIIVIGVLAIIFNYFDALRADHVLITKFGKEYLDYMKKVPRLNFIAGLLRLIKRNK